MPCVAWEPWPGDHGLWRAARSDSAATTNLIGASRAAAVRPGNRLGRHGALAPRSGCGPLQGQPSRCRPCGGADGRHQTGNGDRAGRSQSRDSDGSPQRQPWLHHGAQGSSTVLGAAARLERCPSLCPLRRLRCSVRDRGVLPTLGSSPIASPAAYPDPPQASTVPTPAITCYQYSSSTTSCHCRSRRPSRSSRNVHGRRLRSLRDGWLACLGGVGCGPPVSRRSDLAIVGQRRDRDEHSAYVMAS